MLYHSIIRLFPQICVFLTYKTRKTRLRIIQQQKASASEPCVHNTQDVYGATTYKNFWMAPEPGLWDLVNSVCVPVIPAEYDNQLCKHPSATPEEHACKRCSHLQPHSLQQMEQRKRQFCGTAESDDGENDKDGDNDSYTPLMLSIKESASYILFHSILINWCQYFFIPILVMRFRI